MKLLSPLLIAIFMIACNQINSPMKVNANAKQKLDKFIAKSKFNEEPATLYNGLGNPKLKPELTGLINEAAKDFLHTTGNHPTEEKFQSNIATGLARFDRLYLELDTEDRERICHYFEELMDCVGLKSSNGQLNNWMYCFDPSKKK
ncbi:hypothetical protein Mucpa_3279 [Mucilaginibacter paludis DSM 18603]|uniref:DUF4844 domain-containing protein n=2 Tax=Mucilaginibacter TaxID=423349 RepID=H1YGX4_9SPHI|nr:hypothetical protein Mucpa_3279 [Mucilaginibacter paludis DSM 18603]